MQKTPQVLYEGIAGDIETNDQDSIKIDGVKYKVDDDKGLDGVEYYAENAYTAKKSTDAQNYYTVRVIDLDGDDEVDCVVYLPFTVAEVTYVGSSISRPAESMSLRTATSTTALPKTTTLSSFPAPIPLTGRTP